MGALRVCHSCVTSVDHSCGMQLRQLSSFMDFLLRWLALMALAQVRQVTQLVRVWSHLPRAGGGVAQAAAVQWAVVALVGDGGGGAAAGCTSDTSTASLTASVPIVKGVPAAARFNSSAKAAVAACW